MRNRRISRLSVAIPLVLLWGCASEAPPATSVVRDSLGIRIVENAEPQWEDEERWSIDPEPFLVVGNADGTPPLSNIENAFRFPDGRIVVVDAGGHSLLFFSSEGVFETEVGGEGDGPGEFQTISRALRYMGDSIVVHDFRSARTSFFASNGELGRTATLDRIGAILYAPLTVAPEGDLVWTPFLFPVSRSGETRWDAFPVLRTDPTAARIDTLVSRNSIYSEWSGGQQVRLAMPPFGIFAGNPAGILWAQTNVPEIQTITFGGSVTQIVRWEPDPIVLTPEIIKEIKEAELQRGLESVEGSAAGVERLREIVESRIYPEVLPPVINLHSDPTGAVWVQPRSLPNRDIGRRWQVFRRDGLWMGEVLMPEGFEVMEIGTDFLLGVVLDDFDVPSVALYRLTRGSM